MTAPSCPSGSPVLPRRGSKFLEEDFSDRARGSLGHCARDFHLNDIEKVMPRVARLFARGFLLFEGVIGRAHQRPRFEVLQTHCFGEALEFGELLGMNVTLDGQML